MIRPVPLTLLGAIVSVHCTFASAEPVAKTVFGALDTPSATSQAEAIGSYAKGCLSGGVQLATDGPGWAAMRLKRGRRWAHPAMLDFLHRLAAASQRQGFVGILVGDIGQARGGPMKSGHRSHQIGLDVDIWLRPMTARPEKPARETLSSYDLVSGRDRLNRDLWRKSSARLIPVAARDPGVARIFVNPAIKRAFCTLAPPQDREWLSKLRPWWGHDAHFHVRLACPAGSPDCEDQQPVPDGDGCGAELDWWFTDEPYSGTSKPRKELTMADLPTRCAQIAAADASPLREADAMR